MGDYDNQLLQPTFLILFHMGSDLFQVSNTIFNHFIDNSFLHFDYNHV